jgi:hypothetical protein
VIRGGEKMWRGQEGRPNTHPAPLRARLPPLPVLIPVCEKKVVVAAIGWSPDDCDPGFNPSRIPVNTRVVEVTLLDTIPSVSVNSSTRRVPGKIVGLTKWHGNCFGMPMPMVFKYHESLPTAVQSFTALKAGRI